MPRHTRLVLLTGLCLIASMALAAGAGASAKPTADYRFKGDFKSKGDAPDLIPAGPGGSFGTDGSTDGPDDQIYSFPDNVGLELKKATRVMGDKGKTYTFVMLVQLDDVVASQYRKLVDFDDLGADEGWYVKDFSLYPYDLGKFDYDKQEVQQGAWEQIALTRDANGVVSGYVGDTKIDDAKDKHKDIALGSDHILHFLMDDSSPGEASPGSIARLRIWDTALSGKKIKGLGK